MTQTLDSEISTPGLTLAIETGNAAFEDYPGPELARILRNLASRLERGDVLDGTRPLFDRNGNRVGYSVFTREEAE
jgi:hypothetical protein